MRWKATVLPRYIRKKSQEKHLFILFDLRIIPISLNAATCCGCMSWELRTRTPAHTRLVLFDSFISSPDKCPGGGIHLIPKVIIYHIIGPEDKGPGLALYILTYPPPNSSDNKPIIQVVLGLCLLITKKE